MNASARALYVLVGLNLLLALVMVFLLVQMGSTLSSVNATVNSIEATTNSAPDYQSQLDRLFREVDTICAQVTEGTVRPCY